MAIEEAQPSSNRPDDAANVGLLIGELIARWRGGTRPPVEDFLSRVADLDDDSAVELILAEVLLRREAGEPFERDAYLARFPHLAGVLRARFDRLSPADDVVVALGYLKTEHIPAVEVQSPRPPDATVDGEPGHSSSTILFEGASDLPTVAMRAAIIPKSRSSTLGTLSNVVVSSSEDTPESDERYRLTRLHARGGVGQVWLAYDVNLGRQVALKELRPDTATQPALLDRFVEEAKITGQLEHPGIVPVYELARRASDRLPFYAMRFVQGRTLVAAVREYHAHLNSGTAGRLELDGLLNSFVTVCNTVAYAHSRGVIHRDLKGANVVLGDYGEVIVLDWGFAKVLGDETPDEPSTLTDRVNVERDDAFEETRLGQIVGTPGYMPPEQAEGRLDRLGPRSDVYGLGAILYEIMTGHPPFRGHDLLEILNRVIHEPPVRPTQLVPRTSKALEAICLKALAKEPSGRYQAASELAQEVRRFLSDQPITAYREPLRKRVGRWSKRHRALVNSTIAASLVGFAAIGYLFYESSLRAEQRLTAASGRVEALMSADIRSVPQIIEQLEPDRSLVRDRLASIARGEGPGRATRPRVAASLARLAEDPSREPFLVEAAVEPGTPPEEVLVIARVLAGRGADRAVSARLVEELEGSEGPITGRQLREAGLLAWLDPHGAAWSTIGPKTARKLSTENVLWIGGWREVFLPVSRVLVEPLRVVAGDRTNPEARERAYTLLFDFADRRDNPDRAEDLAALMVEADPPQLDQILGRLVQPEDRERASRSLIARLADPPPFDEVAAGRQARITFALARLRRFDAIWPKFALQADPTVRTELIHDMPRYGVGIAEIAARLVVEPDASARRALILALGEFPAGSLTDADRDPLIARLEGWYRGDPDPGIHGAVDWLLRRRWGRAASLDAIDRSLAAREIPADRGWFVDGQGRTFTVVRGPVTFAMGSSPRSDPDRAKDEETSHLRRIPRSFAIAGREVSVRDFVPFLEAKLGGVVDRRKAPQYERAIPFADSAAAHLTWYEAARYCNWLSEREGIPRSEWCYPEEIGPNMVLDPEHLLRKGYRLPTEAEWEYACRAGTITSRYHGTSTRRLGEYAWHGDERSPALGSPGSGMSRVGLLKPNDLGLFDMLGNAFEWCDGAFQPYPAIPAGRWIDDIPEGVDSPSTGQRSLRGGTYFLPANVVRSASRIAQPSALPTLVIGFRVVRTIP